MFKLVSCLLAFSIVMGSCPPAARAGGEEFHGDPSAHPANFLVGALLRTQAFRASIETAPGHLNLAASITGDHDDLAGRTYISAIVSQEFRRELLGILSSDKTTGGADAAALLEARIAAISPVEEDQIRARFKNAVLFRRVDEIPLGKSNGTAGNLAAVQNGDVGRALVSANGAGISGILDRIFRRSRNQTGVDQENGDGLVDGLAASHTIRALPLVKGDTTEHATGAAVPAPVEAQPSRWQKTKNAFSLSEYNTSERAYIKGQMVFLMSLAIYVTSLPLFVKALTGSAEMTGEARLIHYWTLAFASLFSGKIVQKLGLLKTLRGGSTIRAAIYATIGALSLMHLLPWALFVGLVGFNALIVAHTTLTDIDEAGPGAIMDTDHKIEKSAYLFNTLENAVMVVLPPLVGLGIDGIDKLFGSGIGPKAAFIVFSVVMLWAVQMYSKVRVVCTKGEKALLGFWQTVRLVKDNAAIRTRWFLSTLENFLEDALFSVVLPVYALEFLHLHGFGNGMLMSGRMFGGLIASAMMARYAIPAQEKMGPYKFLVGLTILASMAFIPTIGLWLFPTVWVALPVIMLMKLAYDPIRNRMGTLLQVTVKNDPVAKDHPTELFSLMNFTRMIAAGAGGMVFQFLFEHTKPGLLLFKLFGPMAPMILMTVFLALMSIVYLIGLRWMKAQINTPSIKT